jgi:beta-glucosidase
MLINAFLSLLAGQQAWEPPLFANSSDQRQTANVEQAANDLARQMTLDEKIHYIGGYRDFYTHPVERLHIPALKMSDGPAGVRNYGDDTAYAAPVCLAATWDRDLAHRIGASFGDDANARKVNIVLAPAVNIARVPMNGRNFEYFGEDPYLAGEIVAPWIQGCQSKGVIATVKHFAANSQEHGRMDYSMDVDPRVLHEIYFPAFESAVKKGGVWSVMCAYNLLNGTYCSANHWLLTDVLRNEWGFRGFVMSDWGAVHDTIPVANSGLDLEMPGPEFLNTRTLTPALASGAVAESTIDEKVRRMLRAFLSMGSFDKAGPIGSPPGPSPEGAAATKRTAEEGITLLKNEGQLLPLDVKKLRRIAVIGPNAEPAVWGGGGSAFTRPFHAVSILEAVRARVGSGATVTYSPGVAAPSAVVYRASVFHTADGAPGLVARYYANRDLSGSPTVVRTDRRVNFRWVNPPAPGVPRENFSVEWQGTFMPEKTGDYEIDAKGDDGYRVYVDDKMVLDEWREQALTEKSAVIHLEGGRPHAIRAEYFQAAGDAEMHLGWRPASGDWLNEAVAAAKGADAVILSVGFKPEIEGEGADRTFTLPNGQDELIRRITEANPNTVVVLNAGNGVDTQSWLGHVRAMVDEFYPGETGNEALAEILFGDISPSGKLPFTFDRRWEESAAFGNYPGNDQRKHVEYKEGMYVGYRHYDKEQKAPLFPFGFGLSYTKFSYSKLSASPTRDGGPGAVVTFQLRNSGKVKASEVAQVYVEPLAPPVDRPLKELKEFARVELAPGESHIVVLRLNSRAFAYWDDTKHDWTVAPGRYRIRVGGSSRDLPLSATIRL